MQSMHIHLDPIGGMAGDMFAAAMLDYNPDWKAPLCETIRRSDLVAGVAVHAIQHNDGVLTGHRFAVELTKDPGRHHHRHWRDIRKLAALVPKPWVNLTRFHGVFAPNSKRSEPAAEAAPECPLRSILDVSRVRVLLTGVCWQRPLVSDARQSILAPFIRKRLRTAPCCFLPPGRPKSCRSACFATL
jgi:hypothetical protein